MKCPLCKERIKRNAVTCHFCGTVVDQKTERIQYIKNGFDKIEVECGNLEKRITAVKGFIISWHKFSEKTLYEYLEKIKAFAMKIRSDVDSRKDKKSQQETILLFYNEKVKRLQERLEQLEDLIEWRHPTTWERVRDNFKEFFILIVEKLLPFITLGTRIGFRQQGRIAKI